MIHSMTGFARREVRAAWGSLSCEIRSVNHRYLETSWRLPEELRPIESEFRRLATNALKRGKVECTLRLSFGDDDARSVEIDEPALEGLLTAIGRVRDDLGESAPVSPLEILRWPGIVAAPQRETEPVTVASKELLAATLADLAEARSVEGGRLAALILERCDGIEKLVVIVRTRLPEVRARLRERLIERLASLDVEADEQRLEQELAMLVQRMDVDEEVDRLEGHVEEVRRILGGRGPKGRRLDFLMQELNREANTLASKSQDQETTRASVELKVLIEQMREQIQNIE